MPNIQAGDLHLLDHNSTVALFCFEGKSPEDSLFFGPQVDSFFKLAGEEGFMGRPGEVSVLRANHKKALRYIFIGLGKEKTASVQTVQLGAALAVKLALKHNTSQLSFRPLMIGQPEATAQSAAEGCELACYKFTRFKSKGEGSATLKNIQFIGKNSGEIKSFKLGIKAGLVFSQATILVRNLSNTPPSDMTSLDLLREAKLIARGPIKLKVLGKAQIQKLGMEGLLGVNRGSAKPPIFLHFTYKPNKKALRKIGFCGKGITFDSGGLSLKPPKSMETMKMDMTGAATVIGLFKALSVLKPSIEAHGICVITDNMPGPTSLKPGDVLKAMNGKTIEVLNTDAEGRLVLADALSYASKLNLDELFDIATLTGAATVALGPSITAVMGTDSQLIKKLIQAATKSGEKIWELPLESEYTAHMKSFVADIKNIGRPMQAGTIIGGLFLKEFVKEGLPWVHVDIASTAWSETETPLSEVGATGSIVRTLLHHILSYN